MRADLPDILDKTLEDIVNEIGCLYMDRPDKLSLDEALRAAVESGHNIIGVLRRIYVESGCSFYSYLINRYQPSCFDVCPSLFRRGFSVEPVEYP